LQFQISGERARCALRPAGCVIEELVDNDDDHMARQTRRRPRTSPSRAA